MTPLHQPARQPDLYRLPGICLGGFRKGLNAGAGEEDLTALIKVLRAGGNTAGVRDWNQIGS